MTRTWMTTIFAAATITASASAQGLKANVPFDFTVAGKHMAAGTYSVVENRGTGQTVTYSLRNTGTPQAVLAVASRTVSNDPTPAAKLVFRCVKAGCTLAEIHTPGGTPRGLQTPSAPKGEQERTVAIRMTIPPSATF